MVRPQRLPPSTTHSKATHAQEQAAFIKHTTVPLPWAAAAAAPPVMNALPPPAAGDPFAATLPPSMPSPPPPPSSSSSSLNLSPSLLIIAALLAFVFFASVSIHFILRCFARASSSSQQPSSPSPFPAARARRASEAEEVGSSGSSRRSAAAVVPEEEVVDDEKERLIASLPLFTMASALAALPKSSPDCAVCLSPFSPDAELRLLPACRHAFHAECVDAWLRTTPSCPLCRAAVSLPHPPLPVPTAAAAPGTGAQQEPLDAARVGGSSNSNSRSFRVEIGSVSNRRSSAAGDDRRTYSLGSFDYRVDEEVEAVVSRITRPAAAKSAAQQQQATAATAAPVEALAEAAGSRGWLREYVDRLASSASSLSGRWSARWSQGGGGHHSARWSQSQSQGHHSRSQSQSIRQEESSWRWDPEAAAMHQHHRAPDEEEPGLVALYRWIVGV